MEPSEPEETNKFDKHAKFWKDINRIKIADYTKPICFYSIQTLVYKDEFIKDNLLQIGTELSGLIYDTEDLSSQHKHYLESVNELNITEPEPCPNLNDYQEYTQYFDDIKVEHTRAEHVLDALLQQVDVLIPNNDAVKITHPSLVSVLEPDQQEQVSINKYRPFSCCMDRKYIFEYQDGLHQDLYCLTDPEYVSYNFGLKSLIERCDPRPSCQIDPKSNFLWLSSENQKDYKNLEYLLNVLFDHEIIRSLETEEYFALTKAEQLTEIVNRVKESNIEVHECVELLTRQALKQQLAKCSENCSFFLGLPLMTNTIIITFSQNDNDKELYPTYQHLITKLCFRDYVEYVRGESDNDGMNDDDEINKQKPADREDFSNLSPKSPAKALHSLTFAEFLLNRSLKKHGNDIFVGDSEPPKSVTIVAQETGKKGSEKKAAAGKKKQKSVSTMNSARGGLDTQSQAADGNDISNVKKIVGYNLDDRRFQLENKLMDTYRTAICTINYNMYSWLYRESHMNVDLEIYGIHLLFGNVFNSRGFPLRNIDNALVKDSHGTALTFEVIPIDDSRVMSDSPSTEHIPENCRPLSNEIYEPEPRELVLRYTWATGLIVKTISTNTKVYSIEQMWTKAISEEKGRVLHGNGCVVIYYTNDKKLILSPTGMIVETGSLVEWENEIPYVKPVVVSEIRSGEQNIYIFYNLD